MSDMTSVESIKKRAVIKFCVKHRYSPPKLTKYFKRHQQNI